MRNTYLSTGGLGDALICLAKILQQNSGRYWFHGTGHYEHIMPIQDIQSVLPWMHRSCEKITKNTVNNLEESIVKHCKSSNTKYVRLNTKITEMKHPFLHMDIVKSKTIGNICIQMTAGRMTDNTKRIVHPNVIETVFDHYPQSKIVLIGPEAFKMRKSYNKLINLTGQTNTILDALSIVGGSDSFIGHDGICAYYAAFLKKQTTINYHIPTLTDHYWNKKWTNVRILKQGNILQVL